MKPAFRMLLAVLAVTAAFDSHAEKPVGDHAATPPPASRFRDPEDGKLDLSVYLATPKRFLPVPIVVTEPAVGYGGGIAGMFVRPRRDAGSEGFARPNISMAGGIATENGTWAAFAGDSSQWFGDRLKSLAGVGGGKANLDFYGLGIISDSLDTPVSYSLDFVGLMLQGAWKLRPKSPWSAGLRYMYAEVEPKLREQGPFPGLADSVETQISAPAGVLEFDSRDNLFTPTRGMYAESMYAMSREALGASDDFERFQQVLIAWWPVAEQWTLALRGDYQWSSDGTPFFLRPYIKLRGVEAMRYQGDEMYSAELEARWQMRGRWSVVGAAGFGSAHTEREFFSATREVVSGAVGLRYELARMFGMHVGLDVGFSEDTTAIYLQVGNAWFRP